LEDDATAEGTNSVKTTGATPTTTSNRPGSAPVTDNSKHFLDLSAPVKK